MFGLIHYFYLADTVVTVILIMLLVRRYLQQRNILSLLFTFVMLSSMALCFLMFSRGLFEANTDGSILAYRLSMIATIATPALLSVFLFYPLILEKRQAGKAGATKAVLLLLWVFAFVGMILISISPAVLVHEEYTFDIYSVSFGPISYMIILAIPVLTVLINAVVIATMAVRESEKFYRTRAILLLLGWLLVLAGQLLLLVPGYIILNPFMFGTGVVVMAAAVLRRAPL